MEYYSRPFGAEGLDQVLQDERSASINETECTKNQMRVVSMIQLVFAPKIKHNVLKETIS